MAAELQTDKTKQGPKVRRGLWTRPSQSGYSQFTGQYILAHNYNR